MSRKHKAVPKPTVKTARNSRNAVHKYYNSDEAHSVAYPAGRCKKCKKITLCFCDKCSSWACENHLEKKNELDLCETCRQH
jgi:hypothetical protein